MTYNDIRRFFNNGELLPSARYYNFSGSGVGVAVSGGGGGGISFSNSFWTMNSAGRASGTFSITSSASGFPVGVPSSSFSISFWMVGSGTTPNTWGSAGATRFLLGVRDAAAPGGSRQNSFWFQSRPGNGQSLEWGITDDPDAITICGRMPSPEVYTWNHYLLVYDGSGSANNDRLKIFLNGLPSSSITSFVGTVPQVLLTSSQRFCIGAERQGGSLGQSLVINNIGVYNTALTSSHASAMFGGGSPVDLRTITGSDRLVHYWSDFPVSSSTTTLPDLITNFAGITPMDINGSTNAPNYFTSSGTPVQGATNGSAHDPWA